MSSRLRLVFLGSDTIALPILEWLAGDGRATAEVVAIFTQPDRPVGRGQQVVANGIKNWALQKNIPVLQPEKLTDEVRLQLAALSPDISLVMAYGHILRDPFIETPRYGTLNLHASLLPAFRGASPIQTAIASGEAETGVSLMRIVRKLDAGPVADVERVSIDRLDTAIQVEAKLSAACVPLLQRNLPKLVHGDLEFNAQDESRATYCRRLSKEDGALDFNRSAAELATRINGLFPWPGCGAVILGQPIKFGLAEAQLTNLESRAPGMIIGSDETALRVATGSGELRLLRLQRPGGKMLAASEFLRGFAVPNGTQIESKSMAPLVASEPFRNR